MKGAAQPKFPAECQKLMGDQWQKINFNLSDLNDQSIQAKPADAALTALQSDP